MPSAGEPSEMSPVGRRLLALSVAGGSIDAGAILAPTSLHARRASS